MVPSLLRCSFEHLADASGTALMRLINITVTHYLSAVKTVFPGVANGKQTVQWTFAVSSLRQQDRDGAIAASMFFKHLADASGTALMRLGTASVLISSTSDTFTRKPSEVHCFSRVPPTLLQGNRRRSNVFRGYLRHFCWETVGGPASCLTFKGFVHISQTVSQMLNLMRLAMI